MKNNFLGKTNRFLIYLNIFFLQSYLIRFTIFSYPSNLQEILIVLQAIAFLTLIIKEKKFFKTLKNLQKHWIIISFILLTILSGLFLYYANSASQIDNINFLRYLKFLFFASLFTFTTLESLKTEKEREKLFDYGTYGALLFGIFSLLYNLAGLNVVHDYRLTGPLDSAVMLAFYLAPFLIYKIVQSFEKPIKNNILQAFLLTLLLLATRSAGAIGAVFIITIFIIFKKQNLQIFRNKSLKIFLSLLSIIIVGTIFYTKILPAFQTNYSSLNEREEIWITTINLIKEPQNFIFGLGPGQFEKNYSENIENILGRVPLDYHNPHPHNIFLLFESEYGILGLIFIIFIAIKLTQKLLKRSPGIFSRKDISALILTYFFIHGLIDSPFFKNDMLILFLLTLEIAIIQSYPLIPDTKSNKTA